MKCVSFWDRDVDKFAGSYIVIIWSHSDLPRLLFPTGLIVDFNILNFFHVSATHMTFVTRQYDKGVLW